MRLRLTTEAMNLAERLPEAAHEAMRDETLVDCWYVWDDRRKPVVTPYAPGGDWTYAVPVCADQLAQCVVELLGGARWFSRFTDGEGGTVVQVKLDHGDFGRTLIVTDASTAHEAWLLAAEYAEGE